MTDNRLSSTIGLLIRVGFTVAAVVAAFVAISVPDLAHARTTAAGTVVGWGDNRLGQALAPDGLPGVSAVSAGGFHTLGLTDAGAVIAWGDNSYGQARVPGALTTATQVAAGKLHSLALMVDGTVAGWGDNTHGQTSVPAGLTDVTQVAAGGFHSLALKGDGTVVAWGDNTHGQTSVPAGLTAVTQVSAGGFHSLALKGDGTVVAWGDNTHGQTSVPAGLTDVTQVAAGGFHSLALKGDGTVVAWGENARGQTSVPAGLTDVTQVAAGGFHSLALNGDGTVVTWSQDSYGGTTLPAGLNGVTQVAAGGRHSLALVVDRSVVSAGRRVRTTAENAGVALLTVTRTGVIDAEATARYAPTGGTATPGVDYTLTPGLVTFAAGQMIASIPVAIVDDVGAEADETVTVTLGDPGPGTSIGSPADITLKIAASDQRPDVLISTAAPSGYVGNNVYNLTATGQTQTRNAQHGATRRLFVRLFNDGNATNTLTLHGSAAIRGSSVRFRDADLGFDITTAMRSDAGWPVRLTPGHYMQLTVTITVDTTARIGTFKSVTVTGTWTGDRTLADVVKARVRVVD